MSGYSNGKTIHKIGSKELYESLVFAAILTQ